MLLLLQMHYLTATDQPANRDMSTIEHALNWSCSYGAEEPWPVMLPCIPLKKKHDRVRKVKNIFG